MWKEDNESWSIKAEQDKIQIVHREVVSSLGK